MTKQIDFLVEEPSMEEFLRGVLPKLLGEVGFEIFSFQGKSDLVRNLPKRLRGYAAWSPPEHAIVVLADRDEEDCLALKQRLEEMVAQAGLSTRSRQEQGRITVVNRIVVEELEAWYFGDWEAVMAAYPRVSPTVPQKSGYRDPDAIAGGTWEAFLRVMQQARYFETGLRKLEAAREISAHFQPERNSSRSFQVFRDAVLALVS